MRPIQKIEAELLSLPIEIRIELIQRLVASLKPLDAKTYQTQGQDIPREPLEETEDKFVKFDKIADQVHLELPDDYRFDREEANAR